MGNLFIDRPVFAWVIAIIITVVGFISYKSTPVTQYPDISPPTVTVSAAYPGATAEVVAKTVATPLEEQINGVEGMLYMTSSSDSSGSMSVTVTFKAGTDPDKARTDVQSRVDMARLPDVVRSAGVKAAIQSDTFLMAISIYSSDDRYEQLYLGDYANRHLLDPIKRLPGASSASITPRPDLAMRVWLKPEPMAQLKVTAQEIISAIKQQNQAYAIGSIGESPAPPGTQQSFPVASRGMLTEPGEFEEIMIKSASEGSAIVRLKDVARVELGVRDYASNCRINGKRSAVILVNQQAGANAIETSQRVRALLERLKLNFPAGMEYKVVLDCSTFTLAAMHEVYKTFMVAVLLVMLVVFLFLQSIRATLIPILAVPIAIIGAYTGIQLLGYSTNMLTLFGLILAIGLVVDDAIIVVESVERSMAGSGLNPLEATRKAMRDLTGALIAIVLVLGSVFVPVAFIPGTTGTLYRQFAVTIAISMVLSGVVALTLSPALAARILTPGHGEKRGFFRWFEQGFSRLTETYVSGVSWLISHRAIGVALFAGLLVATAAIYRMVPTSFVPDEDQGFLVGQSILPDAASLERTIKVSHRTLPILRSNPVIEDVVQMDGPGGSSKAMLFLSLKPYEQRKQLQAKAASVVGDLGSKLAAVKEGLVFVFNPPAIPGLGGNNGFEFHILSKGNATPQELNRVADSFVAEAGKRRELTGVRTEFAASQQQLYLDVDRERAELLGIKVNTIYETLQACFGTLTVNQFVKNNRTCDVILQADAACRDQPDDLDNVYVRSSQGNMVPLSAVATRRYQPGPGSLPHFNGYPAVTVNGRKSQGFSSGAAILAMEAVAAMVLPKDYTFEWSGQELEEKESAGTTRTAVALGLMMVFLVLAALYEKWSLPIGVVLSVPFAICGALLLTWGLHLENDIYFKVGLLTLVGLSAKNAILIIQFAAENLHRGMAPAEAAIEAARLRLRPIVMTSLAFILGCVPMAMASEAGARSQNSIGTGVIGGMLASTLVASFFVPLFFVLLEEASAILSRKKPAAVAQGGIDHA